MHIRFEIDGKPQPKERPRVVNGHAYTPKKTKDYEQKVMWAYIVCAGERKFQDAVSLTITVVRAIPNRTSKKMRVLMLSGKVRPISRPDADNCLKTIMDGLNGIAYRDDSQVVDIHISKVFGETDKVIVELEEI